MNGKEYYDRMRELVHLEKMTPDKALKRILNAFFLETLMLQKQNQIILEADFVDLVALQNSKYITFAKLAQLNPDGFIYYLIHRTPKIWILLKDHRRFKDIAERVLASMEPLLKKIEEEAIANEKDPEVRRKKTINNIVEGYLNGNKSDGE